MNSNIFSKAFDVVKDSPFVTLYFVLYLIVLFLIIPVMLAGKNMFLTSILSVLALLLTCAFMAGWFGMIKTAIVLYKKEKSPEEKLEEAIKLRNNFFCSVSNYILPVIFGFVVLVALLYLHSYLSDVLFGRIDNVLGEISKYSNNQEAFKTYLLNIPESTWNIITKKAVFSYLVCSFLTMVFLFFASSLYLNKKCSLNPFFAAVDSVKTMFGKFFETVLIFIFLIVLNFILMTLQAFYINNVVISFITMILRIYFAAYIIVLIFALYENRVYEESQKNPPALSDNCCDRANCIGQDETVD